MPESTTLNLRPLDDRGGQLLDELEQAYSQPFAWNTRTGARSYWINADQAPDDGYEAALDRLAGDWREHLSVE